MRHGRKFGAHRPGGAAQQVRAAGRGAEWLYGRRPVIEALRAGRRRFDELHIGAALRDDCSESELAEIDALARAAGVRPAATERRELDSLLGPVNHQGVALRCGPYPYADIGEILPGGDGGDDDADEDGGAGSTLLILDHIEDPQNLGSLLRSADAFGVDGVIIPEDRAAAVTPAAVRASAGASEHLGVARVVNIVRAIGLAKDAGYWITGLDFGPDAREYDQIDYSGRVALIVGNEGRGISRLVREKCDFIATLPMAGQVASLNAAVAGAVALAEVVRQRRSRLGREAAGGEGGRR